MVVGRRELLRLVLAFLPLPAVALAAAVLGGAGGDPSPAAPAAPVATTVRPEPAPPEPVLREQLLAAHERSRRGTWLVEFDFTRLLHGGPRLDVPVTELNRPPDHLVSGLGGLSGRVGGRRVACSEVDGGSVCAPGGTAEPFEEELAAQLSALRDVLEPPARWYAVEPGRPRTIAGERARCFVLRRVVDVPAPPHGDRAEYCFAADGAPLLSRLERREGTDERVATAVKRRVGGADVAALLEGGG